MNMEDDDFFGIKQLETMPLPMAIPQKAAPAKLAKTSPKMGVKEKTKTKRADIFEKQFFPGVVEQEEEEERRTKRTKSKHGQKEEQEDFFEQHFERKAHFDPHRPEQLQKLLLNKTKSKSSETIDDFGGHSLVDIDGDHDEQMQRKSGQKELWDKVDPVWKFSKEELVDFMAQRVIHETEDFIALDKPFQMAYSGAPKDQAQLDRILPLLKQQIAPQIDRLHLISSLDKNCTGVILFAKSAEKQREFKALLADGHFYFKFRCLCNRLPTVEKARISIPLIKVLHGNNFKLCPLMGPALNNEQLYHLNTDCKVINTNREANVALIDAFTRSGMPHLVRSHLYYGLDCPLLGDSKYARTFHDGKADPELLKLKMHRNAMDALGLRHEHELRRLPMCLHLGEVHVPEPVVRRGEIQFSVVRAQTPAFFKLALKKLALFKK